MNNSKKMSYALIISLLSIVLGFFVGALIMLFFGYNPILAYQAMIGKVITGPYFLGEAFREATVLTFTGLSFALAAKANFFNIGIPGQYLLGWIASVWFALANPDLPRIALVPLCFLVGALAGGFWGCLVGAFKAWRGSNEVITTIMLNYIALYLTNWIIRGPLGSQLKTPEMTENASLSLKWLSELSNGSRLNLGIFIAFIFMVLYHLYINKTIKGFETRSIGLNPEASRYAGMSIKENIILTMTLSGLCAGVGGVITGLGTFQGITIQGTLPSEGFNGIAVALLGMNHPLGIFLSALLFGILNVGSRFMPNSAWVPDEMAQVVIACIIFFVGTAYIVDWAKNKLQALKQAKGKE
ncbi:ABC transporter permease [Aerococcus mictus]|uniref:ABC transporter permease n=1 Tax=Aerococcus mictus TaxID=2976810 RepID=UPI001E389DA2|nr:ABC transporter permease [Aerococcus mictus]